MVVVGKEHDTFHKFINVYLTKWIYITNVLLCFIDNIFTKPCLSSTTWSQSVNDINSTAVFLSCTYENWSYSSQMLQRVTLACTPSVYPINAKFTQMEPSVLYCACLAGGHVNENVKSVKQKALNSTETFFPCLLNPLRKKIAVSVQYNCSMLKILHPK